MKHRTLTACAIILMATAFATAAYAELQNVTVGGEIYIRGRYWNNACGRVAADPSSPLLNYRVPLGAYQGRALGPFGVTSVYRWDEKGNSQKYVELMTSLNVRANFTDAVSAYIDFNAYDWWGEDFRSNYLTGVDARANTADDITVHQAYIEMKDVFGQPLSIRIGRQELKLGKGWLVNPSSPSPTRRNAFDMVRMTYKQDALTIDGWWAKVAENSTAEEDGDVDFYGIYGTYAGWEPLSLSLYWMLVRDAQSLEDAPLSLALDWIQDVFGVDDYDVTNLHTVGLRAFGGAGGFDYDLEAAYQFGEAGQRGVAYKAYTFGDDDAEFDHWAADAEVGYKFDAKYSPRIYLGGAYYDADDNRDITFWEWLDGHVNPFYEPKASTAFNRLWSKVCYTSCQDNFSDMSNFWQVRAGVQAKLSEKISGKAQVAYFGVVDTFDMVPTFRIGDFVFPISGPFTFWTEEADDDLGVATKIWLKYAYSKDLWFQLVWEHLFTGDGMADGNYIARNGQHSSLGTDDDDADYVQFQAVLKF